MDFPSATRWKAALDKEIVSLEKHGVFELVSNTSVPAGRKVVGTRLHSIHLILAIATELDYEVHMLDVQAIFLNADVEDDLFVKMARGYETNTKQNSLLSFSSKRARTVFGRARETSSAR